MTIIRTHTDRDIERRIRLGLPLPGYMRRPNVGFNRRGGRLRGGGAGRGFVVDMSSAGTFARASEGSYISGTSIAYASSGVRRIVDPADYGVSDPATNSGILLEPSRTNNVTDSETLDTSTTDWFASSDPTITGGQSAPDGGADAYQLTDDGTGIQGVKLTTSVTAGPMALSAFVPKDSDETRFPALNIQGGTSDISVSLNTKTGNTALELEQAGWSDISHGAYEIVAGWWRFWVIGTHGEDFTEMSLFPAFNATQGSGTGSAATGSAVFWGVQLELGDFPTSYIRTSGSAATREADDLSIASGSVPSGMLDGDWQFEWYPRFKSSELTQDATLFHFAANADEVRYDQSGGHQEAEDTDEGVWQSSASLTPFDRWSEQAMTVGSHPGSWPSNALQVGARADLSLPFAGIISNVRST